MNLKEFNTYLYYEFGLSDEEDESKVSNTWPFEFTHIKDFDIHGQRTEVYEFNNDDESYYLVLDDSLTFYSKDGLAPDSLRLFLLGSTWIGTRDPVNLNTMDTRPPKIPSIPERKNRFEEIGREILESDDFVILEGLYLKKTKEHLGLVQMNGSTKACVLGDNVRVRNIPFDQLSAWKRLSIGIGKLVNEEKI